MKGALAGCMAALLATAAFAQQPRVTSAKVETRSAASGLEAVFNGIAGAQVAAAWIGYAVPVVRGDRQICCYDSDAIRGCLLESKAGDRGVAIRGDDSVKLEGPAYLVVLYRVEDRMVGKIRTSTPECELDAGGLPFFWLTNVNAAESIRMLARLAKEGDGERQARRRAAAAVTAIALHADALADAELEQLSASGSPESLRRQAVFWMGAARGRRGYENLSRIVREDPSDKLREHAVFALTESKDAGALDTVLRVARDDKSARVRGQALFWLAQKAQVKTAASAIDEAISNDPETEVKKKAVFALTQMPDEQGVPLLIQLARTNRNPAVRKQAMFWLGQSKDRRALAFIEEVLKQ
jgi:hypothetical protein